MKDNIKVNFLVTSEVALIDKTTNNLSIINIFENINNHVLPNQYPKFFVTVNFSIAESSEFKCFLLIKDPDGEDVIKGQEFAIKTTTKGQKIQLINTFNNILFSKEGAHSINLFVGSENIHFINLNIKKI